MTEIMDNETLGLRPLIVNYLLHWKVLLYSALIALFLGIAYLIFYPNTYEIAARIQIQDEENSMSSGGISLGDASGLMRSFGLGGGGSSSINIDDELSILSSVELFSKMVEDLGLYVEYSKPWTFGYKLYGEELLKITCDSTTLAIMEDNVKFDVTVFPNGSAKIETDSKTLDCEKTYKVESLPTTIQIENYKYVIDYAPGKNKPTKKYRLLMSVNRPSWVAESLTEDFTLDSYSKMANVIELSYQDYEKKRCVDMFNTLIQFYNEQAHSYKYQMMNSSLAFINARVNESLTNLINVESKIEAYKQKNQMTLIEFDVQMYAESMKDLQTKMIELEAQTHLLDAMDEFVKNPANKYKLMPSLYNVQEGETSPVALYNQALLERERVIKTSSEHNPMVKNLTTSADRMRESVFLMIRNAKESLDLTRKDLQKKENQILSRMGSVPKQEKDFVDLKRQQEIFQGMYLLLLQKREETVLQMESLNQKARVVDTPYVKAKRVAPRKLYAAIGVIFLTIFLSLSWICIKYIVLIIWSDLKKEIEKKKALS